MKKRFFKIAEDVVMVLAMLFLVSCSQPESSAAAVQSTPDSLHAPVMDCPDDVQGL